MNELHEFEEAKKMPYVTSFERIALEKGRREGEEKGRREALLESLATGLESKFGPEGLEFLATVQGVRDIEVLRSLQEAIWKGATLDELRRLIP